MRIISGEFKGRQLKTPDFEGTRPMTDKARGATFDILGAEVEGAKVLDCFAGTGAVGIEALSRGASHASFVDLSSRATALIRQNLGLLGLIERAKIYSEDAGKFVRRESELVAKGAPDYQLAFYTPPYRNFDWDFLPLFVPLLATNATLVAEKDKFMRVEQPVYANLTLWERKQYGDTELYFFVKVG